MASISGSHQPNQLPSRPSRSDNRYSPYPPNRPTSSSTPPLRATASTPLQTKLAQLKTTLGALQAGLTLLPPVRSTIGGLEDCLNHLQVREPVPREYEELVSHLANLADCIGRSLVQSGTRAIPHSVANFLQDIEEETKLAKDFQGEPQANQLSLAGGEVESMLECYRRIGALSQQLQDDVTSSVWERTQVQQMDTRLQALLPVYEAYYDAALSATATKRGGCTKNTRVALLDGAWDWTRTDDGVKIYWLNGMAGTGKTTIAYTLCKMLQGAKRLGASFFCSRNSPDCRDVNKIVPTIAYQLGRYSNPYRQMLCSVLDEDPDVVRRGISAQFEVMISKPLVSVGRAMPNNVVVVIDALDECTDVSGTKDVLDTLLRHTGNLPIKFFVASRPEPIISERMTSSDGAMRSILWLHDIEKSLVQADIRAYLLDVLGSVLAADSELDALVDKAGCLFIFAATAVRYILPDARSVNPRQRLQRILKVDASRANKSYKDIDNLYTTILSNALDDLTFEVEELEQRRRVLWTVVCAREPLNVSALAELLDMGVEAVEPAMQPLHSVLHVSEVTTVVSTLHASFPDFLLDKERAGRFHCDENGHHSYLADCCFTLMARLLRFNICDLKSSYILDRDVPDFQTRVNEAISPGLFYACRYWSEHLTKYPPPPSLLFSLTSFLQQHLLFWMEVLNLKERIGHGDGMLGQIFTWLLIEDDTKELRDFTHDARSFLITFSASSSSLSTPHIYISSLPFTPKNSWVWEVYWPKTEGLIRVEGVALETRGSMALSAWNVGEPVKGIAQSSDGKRLVSGSGEWYRPGQVSVWDTSSGTRILGPLERHKDRILLVALSPDDTQIASGSQDNTICIWNANSGHLINGPLHGHTDSVNSLSFSLDGAHLASGSSDCTIRIWDAHLGSFLLHYIPLVGHWSSVRSVVFSPDGKHLASGSDDRTIRVWDWQTRMMAQEPLEEHTAAVCSLSYSHDGLSLVSGSADRTVRVWDALSGSLLAGPFEGHTSDVVSVSFSPNSAYIVSGSWDKTIRVWDVGNGTSLAMPLRGHTEAVNVAQFSVDGTRILSGSGDGTIRIWDARRMASGNTESLQRSGGISLLVLSPDGTRLASGSEDGAIFVWDTLSGALVAGPLKGHTWVDGSVGFSPDGARVVFGCCDCTLCILDAPTGTPLAASFGGDTSMANSVTLSLNADQTQSNAYDVTIRMWNPHTRALVAVTFRGSDSFVTSTEFSPNGSCVAANYYNGTVRMWDANDGAVVWTSLVHTDWVRCLAFSPDGTQVASGSDDCTIIVLDALDGTVSHGPFTNSGRVFSLAFSPDGSHLVSGSYGGMVHVWSVQSGTMVVELVGHTRDVYSVLFSSSRIVSGSDDGTIWFWDLEAATQPEATLNNNLRMGDDGWLTNSSLQRLLWVPTDLREDFKFPSPANPLIIGQRYSTSVANSTLFLGDQWRRCYESSA